MKQCPPEVAIPQVRFQDIDLEGIDLGTLLGTPKALTTTQERLAIVDSIISAIGETLRGRREESKGLDPNQQESRFQNQVKNGSIPFAVYVAKVV